MYECINASTELLQRKTSNDVGSALELIAEALIISPFSEQLLEMKAEALFLVCTSFSVMVWIHLSFKKLMKSLLSHVPFKLLLGS